MSATFMDILGEHRVTSVLNRNEEKNEKNYNAEQTRISYGYIANVMICMNFELPYASLDFQNCQTLHLRQNIGPISY